MRRLTLSLPASADRPVRLQPISAESGASRTTRGSAASTIARSPLARTNISGRPKDWAWAYFIPIQDEPAASIRCKFCSWSTARPKALRLRQHILSDCEAIPPADRQQGQAAQDEVDRKRSRKAHGSPGPESDSDQSTSASGPVASTSAVMSLQPLPVGLP